MGVRRAEVARRSRAGRSGVHLTPQESDVGSFLELPCGPVSREGKRRHEPPPSTPAPSPDLVQPHRKCHGQGSWHRLGGLAYHLYLPPPALRPHGRLASVLAYQSSLTPLEPRGSCTKSQGKPLGIMKSQVVGCVPIHVKLSYVSTPGLLPGLTWPSAGGRALPPTVDTLQAPQKRPKALTKEEGQLPTSCFSFCCPQPLCSPRMVEVLAGGQHCLDRRKPGCEARRWW